jgi:hypothetical protein
MRRKEITIVLIFGLLLGCLVQKAGAASSSEQSLLPILQILGNAKLSGSLEFSGRCDLRDFPEFPHFRAAVAHGESPLQALREIFAGDSTVEVRQDHPDGIIRMVERSVPTDLLDVQISHVPFKTHPAYRANDALRLLLEAPEMAAFMKEHHIAWPRIAEIGPSNLSPQWLLEQPHIAESWDNVTVSEGLDRILKTFTGIWIYENCPRSEGKNRTVFFRFFHSRDIGFGERVEE